MRSSEAAAIARLDGHDQAALVRSGEVPADALIEAAALRIAEVDPALNATCHLAINRARAAAAAADRTAEMAGVPYLLKASLEYPGFPAEAGSLARRGATARCAFPLAAALDDAGLIPIGIATMPEFGLNATGESVLYGPTRNPWDVTRSAGGSSTGSAAAVAAGLAPFATASDAGGSIRLPASCCGIVGFKPSRGWNLRARAWNIVDDLLCSDGLYGRSIRDTAWAARRLRPAGKPCGPARAPAGLRIAVDLTGLDGRPPSPDVARVVERAAALCADLGHHVEDCAQPFDRPALREGFTTLWAYSGGEIADRFGETGGLEAWTLGLARRRAAIEPEGLAAAFAQVDRAATALARFHETIDVVLSPVTATVTPKLGHLAPDQDPDRLWEALFGYVNYTPLQNMAGTPGISLPVFATEAGLPAGAMFTAGHGNDELLLALAAQIEAAAAWRDRWPPIANLAGG